MDGVEEVAFLAGSEHRAAMLAALRREGGLDRGTLADRCNAARVTVGRNLEKFENRGIVRETAGGYELTALGELLAEEFLAVVETAALAEGLAPVLRHLSPTDLDFDLHAMADAEVTVSTRADPYAPVSRHERTLEAADEARMLLPAIGGQPLSTTSRRTADGVLDLELVVSADVASTLRTEEYRDDFERILGPGDGSAYVYDGTIPYYLGIVDGSVQIGVDDESDVPQALAEVDDERVREWAAATYESYRDAAEPFEDGA